MCVCMCVCQLVVEDDPEGDWHVCVRGQWEESKCVSVCGRVCVCVCVYTCVNECASIGC